MIVPKTVNLTPQTGRFKARSYDGDYMKAGKIAEKVIIDWLTSHPDVIEVEDLRDVCEIQHTDMDITVRLRDGTHPLAEIKWDRHLGSTGKVLVEVLRLNHKAPTSVAGVLGWTLRTEARWILYFAPRFGYVYQFQTDALRHCLQCYTDAVRADTEFTWISTDRVKSTLCILLPLTACVGAFTVHDVIEFTRPHLPAIDQYRLRFAPEPLQW